MNTFTKSKYKKYLLGGVMALGMSAAPLAAHATPYAFASNAITGLIISTSSGPLTIASGTTPTTNINNTAVYGSYGSSNFQNAGVVGNPLTAAQAYSGPGPSPSTGFTAIGPGNFTGARANATISGGSASSGGVSVSNVAEGYGGMAGNSTGKDNATIDFTVVGTGTTVNLAFQDAVNLIADTVGVPGQTATATIGNTFSVTPVGSTTPVASYAPTEINAQISSNSGVPAHNTYTNTFSGSFTTGVLTAGTVYNISLTSDSTENILPGSGGPTPVPEPGSLALLGTGLIGLALVGRKRFNKS